MRNWIGIVLALVAIGVHAELYKSVDEKGNVTYTDKGSTKSKPVQPPGLTSYAPPTRHTQPGAAPEGGAPALAAKVATSYSRLAIARPASGTALRDAAGAIPVAVEVTPAVDTAAGHKLVILLDGKPAAQPQSLEFQLENVERGEHRITARVVDGKGKVLKESTPVVVQLHRPTVARKAGR
jgi:hypothetical protein